MLRGAADQDAELIWRWANDPLVRANALNPDPIAWEDHVRWFQERMGSSECRIYVGEIGPKPVGQIRFDVEPDWVSITLSVGEEWRGRGVGTLLISEGVDRWVSERGSTRFRAVVKSTNAGSVKAFLKAGFEEVRREDRAGETLLFFERAA